MVSHDANWTIRKCHRVIRPLETHISKYNDLLNKYPYLGIFPFTENLQQYYDQSDSEGSSQTDETENWPSTRRRLRNLKCPGTNNKSDDDLQENGSFDPSKVFEYYKANGSEETFDCLKSIFNIFQQFMKVAYEKPLNSLALLSAFRVGNCIAITEEDITQDTWYCYTETYYGYQQTICLGHGMGLILKNAHILRHVLPAFIHECVTQGWIGMGDFIVHEYISVLSKEEFWQNCNVICTLLKSFPPKLKVLAVQYIPMHLKLLKTVNLSVLVKYFESVDELDSTTTLQFESSLLYCLRVLLRGIKNTPYNQKQKISNYRKTIVDLIRCRFTIAKGNSTVLPSGTFILLITSQYLGRDKCFRDLCFVLNVYYCQIEGISLLDHGLDNLDNSLSSHGIVQLLGDFFPGLKYFRKVIEFLLPLFPEISQEASALYISHDDQNLSFIEWQSVIDERARNIIAKRPKIKNDVQIWLGSWINAASPKSKHGSSEDENKSFGQLDSIDYSSDDLLAPPKTPLSLSKGLDSKYSKILSEHTESIDTNNSAERVPLKNKRNVFVTPTKPNGRFKSMKGSVYLGDKHEKLASKTRSSINDQSDSNIAENSSEYSEEEDKTQHTHADDGQDIAIVGYSKNSSRAQLKSLEDSHEESESDAEDLADSDEEYVVIPKRHDGESLIILDDSASNHSSDVEVNEGTEYEDEEQDSEWIQNERLNENKVIPTRESLLDTRQSKRKAKRSRTLYSPRKSVSPGICKSLTPKNFDDSSSRSFSMLYNKAQPEYQYHGQIVVSSKQRPRTRSRCSSVQKSINESESEVEESNEEFNTSPKRRILRPSNSKQYQTNLTKPALRRKRLRNIVPPFEPTPDTTSIENEDFDPIHTRLRPKRTLHNSSYALDSGAWSDSDTEEMCRLVPAKKTKRRMLRK